MHSPHVVFKITSVLYKCNTKSIYTGPTSNITSYMSHHTTFPLGLDKLHILRAMELPIIPGIYDRTVHLMSMILAEIGALVG